MTRARAGASLPEEVYLHFVPLWLGLVCCAFLAKSGVRLWLACTALSLLLAAFVYGVPH